MRAGGKNVAYSLTKTVAVKDGQLNIRFDASGSDDRDNAAVSGIVVRKVGSTGPQDTTAPTASGGAADLSSGATTHTAIVTYSERVGVWTQRLSARTICW